MSVEVFQVARSDVEIRERIGKRLGVDARGQQMEAAEQAAYFLCLQLGFPGYLKFVSSQYRSAGASYGRLDRDKDQALPD